MSVTTDRDRLEYRRMAAIRDLEELDEQEAQDMIEPDEATRLRSVYLRELQAIDESLAVPDEPVRRDDAAPAEAIPIGGFSPGVVVGALIALVVLTALIVWAGTGSNSVTLADGANVGAGRVDINAMTTPDLEESLAAFPNSVDVRLALADRYLSEGDTKSALEHYLIVSGGDAPPDARSRALTRVAYLSYATGQYGAALDALTESLALDESNTEAMLYMGYVLINGFDDVQSAIPYFEAAIADPSMPREIVDAVSEILADATRGGG